MLTNLTCHAFTDLGYHAFTCLDVRISCESFLLDISPREHQPLHLLTESCGTQLAAARNANRMLMRLTP